MGLLPWCQIRPGLPDCAPYRRTRPRGNKVPRIQPAKAEMRDQQANDGAPSITTVEKSQLDTHDIGTPTTGNVESDSDEELEVDQLIDDDD